MNNTTYRIERSPISRAVVCFYGIEGEDVYSNLLPVTIWWHKAPSEELPIFDTGNISIGSLTLAASILAHHFGETGQPLADASQSLRHLVEFAKEILATQQLGCGEFYLLTTEVINEWLQMKTASRAAEIPVPDPTFE